MLIRALLLFAFSSVWLCASATDAATQSSTTSRALPAAPGLVGFGTDTPAGSGRHLRPTRTLIYRVNSLNDGGPGSLRDCLGQRRPRTCIFEVGGTIKLRSKLSIRAPYVTIAGQTAPAPGITITQAGFSIETHDVLLQHMAVRPGDSHQGAPPSDRDGISIGSARPEGVYNVVLDHLSVSWAIDENVSTWYSGTHDVTISNCLIAEGLHRSIHPKGPHSKGVMIGDGSKRVTLYRNLLTWNEERNPYIKPGASVEVLNNVVYGWGSKGPWSLCNISNNDQSSEGIELSFIGNTYVPGPSSFVAYPLFGKNVAAESRIFSRDNFLQDTLSLMTRKIRDGALAMQNYECASPPIQSRAIQPVSAGLAYEFVLQDVGSRPHHRSAIDLRLLRQVRERRGEIKDCLTGCVHAVGSPDTARPRRRRLRIPRAPLGDRNRDGYTNLENWLQKIAGSL